MEIEVIEALVVAVLVGPFVFALVCFLVAMFFLAHMLRHLKPQHKLLTFVWPFHVVSESSYSPAGLPFLRQFKRWFRWFTNSLFGWGLLALVVTAVVRFT